MSTHYRWGNIRKQAGGDLYVRLDSDIHDLPVTDTLVYGLKEDDRVWCALVDSPTSATHSRTITVVGLGSSFVHSSSEVPIHVDAATGNDEDSGFSADAPVRTLARVNAIIDALDTTSLIRPVVVHMYGSFPEGFQFARLGRVVGGVTFQGQPLVGGEPVTEVARGTGSIFGISTDPSDGANVIVNNIRFSGFTVGFNGYGVLMKGNGSLRSNNCRFVNCDIGIAAIRNVSFGVQYCKASNCTTGFMAQYSASGSFNYCEATACSRGYYITRNSVVHLDFSKAWDCTLAGASLDMAARGALVQCDFRRNAVGVLVEGAAEWQNNDNVFHEGTANANTIPYAHFGAGRETRMHARPTTAEFRVFSVHGNYATSAGADTDILFLGSGTAALPAGFFTEQPKRLRFVVTGELTGTAFKSFGMYRTNTAGGALASIGHASSNAEGVFRMEIELYALTRTTQRTTINILVGGTSSASGRSLVLLQDKALNTAEEWRMRFRANSGNTASSVVVRSVEMFISG